VTDNRRNHGRVQPYDLRIDLTSLGATYRLSPTWERSRDPRSTIRSNSIRTSLQEEQSVAMSPWDFGFFGRHHFAEMGSTRWPKNTFRWRVAGDIKVEGLADPLEGNRVGGIAGLCDHLQALVFANSGGDGPRLVKFSVAARQVHAGPALKFGWQGRFFLPRPDGCAERRLWPYHMRRLRLKKPVSRAHCGAHRPNLRNQLDGNCQQYDCKHDRPESVEAPNDRHGLHSSCGAYPICAASAV
jgi:hypothetical protein